MEKHITSDVNTLDSEITLRTNQEKVCGKTSPDSPLGAKTRKKKTLQRGNAFHGDECNEPRDENNVDFIYVDNNIFPSPVAITQEEALRETCCHVIRQNSRQQLMTVHNNNNDETCEDSLVPVVNGVSTDTGSVRRREAEKPPRLQKQASRDRMSSSHNKQTNTSESSTNITGTNQKDTGSECLDSMGVDVHEFLVKALQSNPRDRSILLKLEYDMVKFVNSKQMLVHRVAAYFGMDHNIDAKGTSVIINKTKQTRLPDIKFSEHILSANELNAAQEDMRRRSILKRMQNCQSLDHSNSLENNTVNKLARENWKSKKQRSFEERENNYEKIRARIFQQLPDDQRFQKEPRSKDKERILAQWKKRPWSSTDLGSLPGQKQSIPVFPDTNGLNAKSSSFSGITVLSRQSNNDGGSLSSSTSSVFVEQPQNGSTPEEWNEMANHQPPNQPSRPIYSNMESLSCQNFLEGFSSCHVVELSEKQLVIAVPDGFTIKPGTLLTHPTTGHPYVNLEGFPILYPSDVANIPAYPTRPVPVQYPQPHPYNTSQPGVQSYTIINSAPDTADVPPQQPPIAKVGQNQMPGETNMGNSNNNTPVQHVYHPAVYPQYQQAPVHLLYYPSAPAQVVPAGENVDLDKTSTSSCVQEATEAIKSLHLNSNKTEMTSVDATCNDKNPEMKYENTSPINNGKQSSLPSSPTATHHPTQKVSQSTMQSDATMSTNKQNVGDLQQNSTSAVTTLHMGHDGAFYSTSETNIAKSKNFSNTCHAGVATHPILNSSQHLISQASFPSKNPHGHEMINPISGQVSDFYTQSAGGVMNYNYVPSPSQPVYYVVPNNTTPMQTYQNSYPQQVHGHLHFNPPMVYSPMPHGYVHPHLPMQPPPHPFHVAAVNEGGKPQETRGSNVVANNQSRNLINSQEKGEGLIDIGRSVYPLMVRNHEDGIHCPSLNKFAAKYDAKIVQFGSSKDDTDEKDDIYLLFPSLDVATKAANILQNESSDSPFTFRLDNIQDSNQLNDVISQVRELDNVKR